MKVKVNLTNQTLEYLDSKPYIQGEDSRNKLIVYVDAEVTLTNIQIAYQLQNGRNTIKLINDSIIADDVDTENADYLEGYNGFVFNAPLSVTNVAGNFFATVIFTISTNVYKINVLNTVLKAVDFENFENALEGEKADLIAFMNSTASSITIIEQDIRKVLATTSTMANDVVQDYTALTSYQTTDLPDGFRVLVMNDSNYDNNPVLYQWNLTTWVNKGYFDWTGYLDTKFDGYKETTDDYIDSRLDAQDETIAGLGQLKPSGTDTSTNILAFTEDKGIYIGTDTGYWYYWNVAQEQYVSGGVYQASEGVVPETRKVSNISLEADILSDPLQDSLGIMIKNLLNYSDENNLTNKRMVLTGGGNLAYDDVSGWTTSHFIAVYPSEKLYLRMAGVTDQVTVACFDRDKEFISFGANVTTNWEEYGIYTVPANAYWIRVTFISDQMETNNVNYGYPAVFTTNNTDLKYPFVMPYGNEIGNKMFVELSQITQNGKDAVVRNLFNEDDENNTLNERFYYNETWGFITDASSNWGFTSFIPVHPSQKLYFAAEFPANFNYIAYFDENKTCFGARSKATAWETVGEIIIPNNCWYIIVAYNMTIKNSIMLLTGGKSLDVYLPFGNDYILNNQVNYQKKTIITVGASGRDFTTLKAALNSITNASELNPYEIRIDEGTYEVFSDFTSEEIEAADFYGLIITDGITLKGVGKKENTILHGELVGYDATKWELVSTLNVMGNYNLENLTVTATNLRYVVHDDRKFFSYSKNGTNCHIKNCDFILNKDYGTKIAWGMGLYDGEKRYFENCSFNPSFSTHNDNAATIPSFISCKNCIFYEGLGTWDNKTNVKDEIELVGCSYQQISMTYNSDNAIANTYQLKGYANSIAPISSDNPIVSHINGETLVSKNGSANTINIGYALQKSSGISFELCSDIHLFCGVTMESVSSGNYTTIRTKGYIKIADLPYTLNANVGDKIGIDTTTSQLQIVNNADYVGICDLNGYIKLL